MKIINGFLFCNKRWRDHEPTPCVIDLDEITMITEQKDSVYGNCIAVHIKSNPDNIIVIEGDINDFMIEFAEKLEEISLCGY